MRCPICEREFDPAAADAAKPFCSERCRVIDLGRWLGESYTLPDDRPNRPDLEGGGESDSD